MEKETPDEKKLRELKDAYEKEVAEAKKEYQKDIESAMKETPTEEVETRGIETCGEALEVVSGVQRRIAEAKDIETPTEEWGDKPGVIELIEEAITSHNAELRRKIEGLLVKEYMKGSPAEYQNKILLAVLALLDNKNV